jgi:hypothetical protein
MVIDSDYKMIQVIALLLKWSVLWMFGLGIIAHQLKLKKYPRWPMPGAWVGAAFLLIDGLLPLHMALTRLGWLPWEVYSLEATVLFVFIAGNSALAFARWWQHGFEDAPGPWDGRAPYTGKERRGDAPGRRITDYR